MLNTAHTLGVDVNYDSMNRVFTEKREVNWC